jgi:hypothetical protein
MSLIHLPPPPLELIRPRSPEDLERALPVPSRYGKWTR